MIITKWCTSLVIALFLSFLIKAQEQPLSVDISYINSKVLSVRITNLTDYEIWLPISIDEGDTQSAVYFDLIYDYRKEKRRQFYDLQSKVDQRSIRIPPRQTYVKTYRAGDLPLLSWSMRKGTSLLSEHIHFTKANIYLKYVVGSPKPISGRIFKDFEIKSITEETPPLFRILPIYKPQTRELIIERYNWTDNTIMEPFGQLIGEQKDTCLYITYKNDKREKKMKYIPKDSVSIVYAKLPDLLKEGQNKGTKLRKVIVASSFYYQKKGNRKWEHYQHLDTLSFPPQDKVNYFTNETDSNGMYFLFRKVAERLVQNRVQAKNTNKQSDQADLKKRFAPYMESTNKFESDWANDVILGDTVYESVDRMPEFPGGQSELLKYISVNLKYPKHFNDQVRVIIKVIVEKDGTLSHARVIRGSTYLDADREALKVLISMPNWTPGYKDGKPVRTYFTIPVMFRLQ